MPIKFSDDIQVQELAIFQAILFLIINAYNEFNKKYSSLQKQQNKYS